ncbi:uncharacterized protein LOC143574125 [Bidens hawaiensis]|uniref:uncharacterized protein LOC143574125 n=1 Tax=Bidens hawaiensis TaxID=980011 RepID=UPI00404B7FE2
MADQHNSDDHASTNKQSDDGVSGIADVALDSSKAKGTVADKPSDKDDRVAEVAVETLKQKDKQSDKDETIAEVARVADEQSDKGEIIAEVALESLKSKGVEDKHSDEGQSRAESMASGSTVEINIKTLDSQLHNFIVDKNMPVSKFKESIASEVGLSVDQQRLIFRGKVLKDEDPLSEYHVESGHTLHLVARQPSEFQPSSGSPNAETTARSSNAGQDDNGTGTRPRVGHVSHSVVLGTFGVGEQDEGGTPDVNQVIGAVLNFFGQGLVAGGGAAQPHMQFSIPVQVAHGNETVNQSQPRSPSQSILVEAVPAVPTLATPIPESLHTLSEFMNHMDRTLSQNRNSTEGVPSVELPTNARGLPSLSALAVVMRQAQRLLSGPAVDSLSHIARRLEEAEGVSDATMRTEIQTEAMRSGLAMQHLGALLLELGRTMLTLRIGQSHAESSVNAGPAVYISPSGPNPIMVQPFPLQTNSLFSGDANPALNHGLFGPVGIGAGQRNLNIHIHPGPRATNVESNLGEHANINRKFSITFTRGAGDNMRSGNQSSVGQADGGLPEDAGASSTRMKSLSETEGGSSSSRSSIPLGLGPGGLQPKRRHRQTNSGGASTSFANQNQPSAGGQLDPAAIMNQIMQNHALNNILAGASNQNGPGSQDFFRNIMGQLTQNPEMMNSVNQLAQQMDGNQDVNSMLAGMGGPGGGGSGSGNLDMSSLVQQMMPFVSQALSSGSSSSSSSSNPNPIPNKLQPAPSRKGSLSRRFSSVKSMNKNERKSEFQMNLENAAQKIMEHYPPVEVFSSVVQTAAALRNDVYDENAINALCMEEELAQEFNEMLKRDISEGYSRL